MFRSHKGKFKDFLYVNGQRNLLSRPCQPTLGFNIVPYGTKNLRFRNFTIGLIQSKEYPSIGNFSKY